jgi:hypothetical protein
MAVTLDKVNILYVTLSCLLRMFANIKLSGAWNWVESRVFKGLKMGIMKYIAPETGESLPYRLENLAVHSSDMPLTVYWSTSRNVREDGVGSSSASLCESQMSQCRIRCHGLSSGCAWRRRAPEMGGGCNCIEKAARTFGSGVPYSMGDCARG